MRISKEKFVVNPVGAMPPTMGPSISSRKKDLIAAVQAALRVGADLAARETGRRAFAEYLKLERGGSDGKAASASEQILFSYPRRRKNGLPQ